MLGQGVYVALGRRTKRPQNQHLLLHFGPHYRLLLLNLAFLLFLLNYGLFLLCLQFLTWFGLIVLYLQLTKFFIHKSEVDIFFLDLLYGEQQFGLILSLDHDLLLSVFLPLEVGELLHLIYFHLSLYLPVGRQCPCCNQLSHTTNGQLQIHPHHKDHLVILLHLLIVLRVLLLLPHLHLLILNDIVHRLLLGPTDLQGTLHQLFSEPHFR